MGEHGVRGADDAAAIRGFTRALLSDIDALEELLAGAGIETGMRRVGLEQEMFLVDARGRPACVGPQVLRDAKDPRLTTELAQFNLEANLPPQLLTSDVLTRLESELNDVIAVVNGGARAHDAAVLLTGILPSLQQSDLTLAQMTPEVRYQILDRAVMRLRGGPFQVFLQGTDELNITHDCVVLESANTSFQLHLQVEAEEFAELYNLAQLVTGPLLAAAVGSPLLLGKRLWQETRVALFERTVDVRSAAETARGGRTRVSFGDDWVQDSVLEVFREDAARFRVLVTREAEQDPVAIAREGRAPRLHALSLHNSTVWRWNRACYGSDGETAHLRIENRVVPSGPTVIDEVANAALFWGVLLGLRDLAPGIAKRIAFDNVRANFIAAARHGLDAQFSWLDGKRIGAQALLLEELLPSAQRGLESVGVDPADLRRSLGVLEGRVTSGRTTSQWMLRAFESLRHRMTAQGAACELSKRMLEFGHIGEPVHTWPELNGRSSKPVSDRDEPTLREIMTTDLFTLRPDDIVDLASSVMRWRRVRHVPVEDENGKLVGLLTTRSILEGLAKSRAGDDAITALDICDPSPLTLPQETRLSAACQAVLAADASCALVIGAAGHLVGLVTERDLLRALAPGQ